MRSKTENWIVSLSKDRINWILSVQIAQSIGYWLLEIWADQSAGRSGYLLFLAHLYVNTLHGVHHNLPSKGNRNIVIYLKVHTNVYYSCKMLLLVQVQPTQKYYAPHIQPDQSSNPCPSDHDSTFHVSETPILPTRPSGTPKRNALPHYLRGRRWFKLQRIWVRLMHWQLLLPPWQRRLCFW